MDQERRIKILKKINEEHTYSKYCAVLIDQLIEKHTFVCFVFQGVIYDFSSYQKIMPTSYSVSFGEKLCGFKDFSVIEYLSRAVLLAKGGEPYYVGVAYADVNFLDKKVFEVNTSVGLPKDEPVLAQKFDDSFSLSDLNKYLCSQPFVSFAITKQSSPDKVQAHCAVIDIQDGDALLYIA